MGTLFNNAAESFFKSEICRRLFVTAILLVMSRVGYFILLPGFDRKLMPEDYLRFVSGSVGMFCLCLSYSKTNKFISFLYIITVCIALINDLA